MLIYYLLLFYFLTAICFSIIHKIGKSKKPVLRGLASPLTGLLCLIVVNLAGVFTGVYIPYSIMNIGVSIVGGIPGITALLAINLFF